MKLFKFSFFLLLILFLLPFSVSAASTGPCSAKLSNMNEDTVLLSSVQQSMAEDVLDVTGALQLLAPLCYIESSAQNRYTDRKDAVSIMFSHKKTSFRPRIAFFNSETGSWIVLPTTMNSTTRIATAEWKGQSGVWGVFADTRKTYEGIGSWYAHKGYTDGVATNLFPLGTRVRITNIENGKSIVLTVRSTWAQQDPRRIADIVKPAFRQLASLHKGVITVRMEKL